MIIYSSFLYNKATKEFLQLSNRFLLKIIAEDWDDYQRFLTTQLTAAPNVSHVKSALAIRCSKSLPGVPIDDEDGDEESEEGADEPS